MLRSNPKLSELQKFLNHHKSKKSIPANLLKIMKKPTDADDVWYRGAASAGPQGGLGLALFGDGLYLAKSPYFALEYADKHPNGTVFAYEVNLGVNVVQVHSVDFIEAFEKALVLANPMIDIGHYAFIDRKKRTKGSLGDILRLAYRSPDKKTYTHYLSLLEDEISKVVSFEVEPQQQEKLYQILREELESKGYRGVLAYTLRKGLLLFDPERDAELIGENKEGNFNYLFG